MYPLVTVSGLSYTGKTSLSKTLAHLLDWQFVSAGERFRNYSESTGVSLINIPQNIHEEFDRRIKDELRYGKLIVMEGRYLAYLATELDKAYKILVEASHPVRQERCVNRDKKAFNDAGAYIAERDAYEHTIAHNLYGIVDFTDHTFYDLVVLNNNRNDFQNALNQIIRVIRT